MACTDSTKVSRLPCCGKRLIARPGQRSPFHGVVVIRLMRHLRFGVYEALKENATSSTEKPSTGTLIALSSFSGFLGGLVGNPADILNVRMQHDAALPAADRRNYKHAIDGIIRMAREEGISSLWRGVWPNSARGVLMTASQLASYDSFKNLLLSFDSLGMKDDLTTHFSASLMAGFVATTLCSPVDVIKTRVMSAKDKQGLVHLLTNIYAKEGVTWCFKGWLPVSYDWSWIGRGHQVDINSHLFDWDHILLRPSSFWNNTRKYTATITDCKSNWHFIAYHLEP